ncbi:MAG: hypothetical protein ACREBB_04055 [Nitrosotalea sp.]
MKKFIQERCTAIQNYWKEMVIDIKKDNWSRMFYFAIPFIFLAILFLILGHFELDLAITLTIVEIPIFVFGAFLASRILRESLEREMEIAKGTTTAEGMKGHKKDLLEMLEVNAYEGGMNWTYGRLDRFYWNDRNRKLSYLLVHLKEYNDVYRLYELSKNFSNEQCDKIQRLLDEFFDYVNKQFESFIDIPVKPDHPLPLSPAFMKSRLIPYLLTHIYMNLGKEKIMSSCEIVNDSSLQYGKNDIAYGNIASLQNLKKLIQSLETDHKMQSIVTEITKIGGLLNDDTLIKEFNEKRKALKIEHEHKNFKGKCDACPESV